MKKIIPPLLFSTTLLTTPLQGNPVSEQKVEVLYSSLDKKSIPKLLSFYSLYPKTSQGKKALNQALQHLSAENQTVDLNHSLLSIDPNLISKIINTFSKPSESQDIHFSRQEISTIQSICKHLPHNALLGHRATTESEVVALPDDQIDVARAVFVSQGFTADKIENFEAALDLMALQILSKLSDSPSPQEIINEINSLLFDEMHFRFPPHSLYAKNIDEFTFLSSVLESRRGVCLGVSVLYLSLAQRLDLPLEIVTPPGHIYVRYRDENAIINIETTNRGVHIDTKHYLGVETVSSHLRNRLESVGLTHTNQAAVFWQNEEYDQAIQAYRTSKKYFTDDYLLKLFLGLNLIFTEQTDEGEKLLKEIRGIIPEHAITTSSVVEDYLDGKVDAKGIITAFQQVDETRTSILKKQKELQKMIDLHPQFRDGVFHLAITYLQLNRQKEGLEILERYHTIDSQNPTVEYYLSLLYLQRLQYDKAWKHFNYLEEILATKSHNPKAVTNLKKTLKYHCPISVRECVKISNPFRVNYFYTLP